jgi:hypothetical protein
MLTQKKKAEIKHDMQQWKEVKALREAVKEIEIIIKKVIK